MIPRERNAFLAPLSGHGLRRFSRDQFPPRLAPPDAQDRAREDLVRLLATLRGYTAADLMRRCFPFEQPATRRNSLDPLED